MGGEWYRGSPEWYEGGMSSNGLEPHGKRVTRAAWACYTATVTLLGLWLAWPLASPILSPLLLCDNRTLAGVVAVERDGIRLEADPRFCVTSGTDDPIRFHVTQDLRVTAPAGAFPLTRTDIQVLAFRGSDESLPRALARNRQAFPPAPDIVTADGAVWTVVNRPEIRGLPLAFHWDAWRFQPGSSIFITMNPVPYRSGRERISALGHFQWSRGFSVSLRFSGESVTPAQMLGRAVAIEVWLKTVLSATP